MPTPSYRSRCASCWGDIANPTPNPTPNPDPNPTPNPDPDPEPNQESLFGRIEHAQREALGLAAAGGGAGGDEISEVISDLDVFVVK